jgi:phospholipid-translocating ATPase
VISIIIQSPETSDIDNLENSTLSHLCGKGSKMGSLLICKGDYGAMKSLLDQTLKEKEELEKV